MANLFFPDYTPEPSFAKPEKPTYHECISYYVDFLKHFSFFNQLDLNELDTYWDYCVLKKNTLFIEPNQKCDNMMFICKGAVKYYMEDEKGRYIMSFLTEANHCAPVKSFYHQTRSEIGAVCTEDVYGLQISYSKFQQLIKDRPAFEALFTLLIHENVMYLKNRLKTFQSLDAHERFILLMHERPEVLNRFSMLDIANYLGIKPETLSRLRRNDRVKK